jgi:hypothetical protein
VPSSKASRAPSLLTATPLSTSSVKVLAGTYSSPASRLKADIYLHPQLC